MKCQNIIKYGVSTLSFGTLLFYLMNNVEVQRVAEFTKDGKVLWTLYYTFERFVVHYLLLPVAVISILLFLYALYCLQNSVKEKLLALMLVIAVPFAVYYSSYYALTPRKDLDRYYDLYHKKFSQNLNQKSAGDDLEDRTGGSVVGSVLKEVDQDILKEGGETLALKQKSFMYNFMKVMLLGIVSVGALYASTLYTLASIIGVSLMYVGTIISGLMFNAESLRLHIADSLYGFDLVWLKLLFLLVALGIVVRVMYQSLKKVV